MDDSRYKNNYAKAELRSSVRKAKHAFLNSTALPERHSLSEQILGRVEQLPQFREAGTVLAYYSLADELFTHDFVQRWADKKTILLPKVVGEDLTLHRYTDRQSLREGAFGIMEPCTPEFTDYAAVDMVIVPGVAFDRLGNRLGRGRGYYDRLFASRLPQNIYKMGVCYPFQLVESVPTEPCDVQMDEVVTNAVNQ